MLNYIFGVLLNCLNIHRHEVCNILQTSLVMFFILACNTIVRIMKDSIIIPEIGPEILNSIKLFVVLPVATFLTLLYNNLIDKYSFRQVFIILGGIFISYYAIFGFILYPKSDLFHMSNETLEYLAYHLPMLKWQIYIIGKWSYSIFYTMAELYPNIFYILMFWQLANGSYTIEQSWRLYPIISIIGNCGTISIGLIYSSYTDSILAYFNDLYPTNIIQVYLSTSLIIILFSTALYLMSNKSIDIKPKKQKNKNRNLSFIETVKYLYNSHYLWYIFVATAAFAMSINLVENIWKDKMRLAFPNSVEYSKILGEAMFYAGMGMVFFNLISSRLLKALGWLGVASLAPVSIGVTGIIFFISVLVFDNSASSLHIAIWIGFIQNIISKSIKYSTTDTVREMLYIPVDRESRLKGKAAIDLISSKIGKSFSSILYASIFSIFPSITYNDIAIYIAIIFTIIIIYWLWSVIQSGRMYSKLLSTQKTYNMEDIDIKEMELKLKNIKSTFDLAAYVNKVNYNNQSLIFSRGTPKEIMIIGEAPGHYEDIEKKPFIGRSGNLLQSILSNYNISSKKNLYITNLFLWKPENNRNPNAQEISFSMPILKKHIELIQPKIILTLGNIATNNLLDLKKEKLTDMNGKTFYYKNIPTIPIVHPAYILRQPNKRYMLENAIKNAYNVYKSI